MEDYDARRTEAHQRSGSGSTVVRGCPAGVAVRRSRSASRESMLDSRIGVPSANSSHSAWLQPRVSVNPDADLDCSLRGSGGSVRSLVRALPRAASVVDGSRGLSTRPGRLRCSLQNSACVAAWRTERTSWRAALRSAGSRTASRVATTLAIRNDAPCARDERVPRMESYLTPPAMPDLLDRSSRECGPRGESLREEPSIEGP